MAFGALGLPIIMLQAVTGLNLNVLASMVSRILTPFCLLLPFWLVWAFAGFQSVLEVWPAILVGGVTFALIQLLMSNLHGPWLVDMITAPASMVALILFLLKWRPKKIWIFPHEDSALARGSHGHSIATIFKAWLPWVILSGRIWACFPKKQLTQITAAGNHQQKWAQSSS